MASTETWSKELLVEGNGVRPEAGDYVVTHYVGTFHDSTREFDSSRSKGRPFKFILGQGKVIKAWDECVATMSVGEKSKLVAPPNYAYGSKGAGGGLIPPNATLDFEMELLAIVKWEKTITKAGTGALPRKGQTCVVDYVGTFPDGSEFDSSRRKGRKFKFQLGAGRVIKAWDACVATMKIGERCQLIAPSDFAYGDEGRGPIPGKATLHFDIELYGVE